MQLEHAGDGKQHVISADQLLLLNLFIPVDLSPMRQLLFAQISKFIYLSWWLNLTSFYFKDQDNLLKQRKIPDNILLAQC